MFYKNIVKYYVCLSSPNVTCVELHNTLLYDYNLLIATCSTRASCFSNWLRRKYLMLRILIKIKIIDSYHVVIFLKAKWLRGTCLLLKNLSCPRELCSVDKDNA